VDCRKGRHRTNSVPGTKGTIRFRETSFRSGEPDGASGPIRQNISGIRNLRSIQCPQVPVKSSSTGANRHAMPALLRQSHKLKLSSLTASRPIFQLPRRPRLAQVQRNVLLRSASYRSSPSIFVFRVRDRTPGSYRRQRVPARRGRLNGRLMVPPQTCSLQAQWPANPRHSK